ncbi:glycosyltransferase family 2 protein [Pengzhenrongella frigida]|uniref:glycosyltransferase family 2 protein n=1 Tax=Pengzhenrongella frigida TaxID=1259133 RepID=UPI0013EBF361|nr:glycosyltransferase family 2 protein [Cellulomonas sp. HLT2-17]
MSVDASVIVVSWNARELTLRCLDSLLAQNHEVGFEVVVVDNGSTDGSVEALRLRRDARLIELGHNTGFACAVNAGIRATSTPVVVLLNNDATADPDFVRTITAPLLADADAERGGPRLGATTGRVQLSGAFEPAAPTDPAALVSAAGKRWVRVDAGAGVTLLNSTGNEVTVSGNGRDRDWLAPSDGPGAPADVFGFNGGCAALRRLALDDVGLLDETLFVYYEDSELSWRLRRGGWSVRHVDEARTVHDHAASSGERSTVFLDNNERNRLSVALMHAPWPVVGRGTARAAGRALLGPDRRRRLLVLRDVAARLPGSLRRRRAVDRAARVPRQVVARYLVPDGGTR